MSLDPTESDAAESASSGHLHRLVEERLVEERLVEERYYPTESDAAESASSGHLHRLFEERYGRLRSSKFKADVDSGALMPRRARPRQVPGKTPASIKSVIFGHDNAPVFIGTQRNRRYVLQKANAKEVHINYTGSSGQEAPTTLKESRKRFDGQAEPDNQLLEETEDLLRTWLEVPPSQRHNPPSQHTTFPRTTSCPLENQSDLPPESDIAPLLPKISDVGIREHLKLWQELHIKNRSEALATQVQNSGDLATNVVSPGEDDASNILETSETSPDDHLDLSSVTGVDEEGDTDDQHFLRTGDVVDFSTQSDSMLAIYIRNVGVQAQFYNVKGKWFHKSVRTVAHVVPRMFSVQELEPILPYLPTEEIDNNALDQLHVIDASVPRSIGAALVEKLQAFHRAAADVYRGHLERIDRAHSLVAHAWQRRELSLQEIASIVLQKPDLGHLNDVELWTIHKVLIKDSKFRPKVLSKHWTYPIWRVNPLNYIRDYERVKRWLREHIELVVTQATSSEDFSPSTGKKDEAARLNPASRFINKAKALIEKSRVHRKIDTYSSMGPSSQQVKPEPSNSHAVIGVSTLTVFDAEERCIIQYLQDWVLLTNMPRIGSTWSLGPMLLRAIGMYEDHDLDVGTGSLLLKELGVIAPWENAGVYTQNVRLPYKGDPQVNQLLKDASSSVESMVQSGERLEDSLEGLRKDWGNMNVYCIDQSESLEIDDGVSVEKIEGQDSVFWIHIHVASPAAFIKPSSPIAQYAATMGETHYFPEKVYPMLNPELTQRHFSLANDRPVLTFSAKIALNGEMLATKVTPGWVRKTKRLTPDRVGQDLGLRREVQPRVSHILTVGQPVPLKTPKVSEDTTLSPSQVSELRLLYKLGLARRLKRKGRKETEAAFTNETPVPGVYLQQGGMALTFCPDYGRQFIGDPTISWEAREVSMTDGFAQDEAHAFVADMMIVAGEIASRWCVERNIPIAYRGTVRNPSLVTTPEAYRARVLDPVMKEMGYIPVMFRRKYNLLIGTSTLRSTPFPHGLLDTETYTKATSPLRRYQDMLAHWQIQAALCHEAQHGQGCLIDSTDDTYLPFSRAAIDAMLPTIDIRERGNKGVRRWSKDHWTLQLLHRAFEFKQAPLPPVFDVLVHTEKVMVADARGETMGFIKQLSGINSDLLANDISEREGGHKLGDWWQARIERVDTYKGRIKMIPIRLIERVSEDIGARYGSATEYRMYQSSNKA
ncbi:MAG: hypothetical protein Q9166_000860 [cf. Caloplaca sp. 2 TL-2023]